MRTPFLKAMSNSLKFKLTLSVLIMTLPMIGMLLYNNVYSIDVVRAQVADSYKSSLSLYMDQIDASLNDIDSYLNTLAGISNDLIGIKMAVTDEQYYLAKAYIFNKFSYDMPLYPVLGSFFLYVEDREDYMEVYSPNVSYTEKELVKAHIIGMIDQQNIPRGLRTQRWQHARIGGEAYLINIVPSGDVYVGAWVKAEELMKPLQALNLGEDGATLIASQTGEPLTEASLVEEYGIELREDLNNYYLSGSSRKYLVVGTGSYRGNFNLVALIPDRRILENLPYLQRLIWIMTIGVLIFIPVGLAYMSRALLQPLKRMLGVMSRVKGGDWSVRIQSEKDAEEFKVLARSFNDMMNEIQTLRVNVFEEQLNKQREELQRLQLQVNPHFFLNSLNIVYNLAKVRNYQLIKEMSMALIHYFRYLFRSNTSFVKIEDELEHTRNYLRIQSMRFPERLTWDIRCPDYLQDLSIPPLVIQSFVENSIKYALTMDNPIHIDVQLTFREEAERSGMKITIRDNGRGFEEEVLRELQSGRSVETERGERTGIWNVQRRLKLLYKEDADISFANDPVTGGAVVELMLPIHPKMEVTT